MNESTLLMTSVQLSRWLKLVRSMVANNYGNGHQIFRQNCVNVSLNISSNKQKVCIFDGSVTFFAARVTDIFESIGKHEVSFYNNFLAFFEIKKAAWLRFRLRSQNYILYLNKNICLAKPSYLFCQRRLNRQLDSHFLLQYMYKCTKCSRNCRSYYKHQ